MKKIFYILLVLPVLGSNLLAGPWDFYEQVSGVTTRLNFVSLEVGYSGGSKAWICGNNGVVLRTTNTGANWINVGTNGIPNNVNLNFISTNNYNNQIIVFTSGVRNDTSFVYRTTNLGINWSIVFNQKNGKVNGIRLHEVNPVTAAGYLIGDPVGGRWTVFKTTNGGVTWDSSGKYIPALTGAKSYSGSMSGSDSDFVFGTNNFRIYYTTNIGVTWQYFNTLDSVNSSLHMSFNNYYNSVFGFTAGSKGIYYTSNTGTNWSKDTTILGSGIVGGINIRLIPVDNYFDVNMIYVRNDNKIYHSYNGFYNIVWYTAPSGNYTHVSGTYGGYVGASIIAVRDNGGISWCACPITSTGNSANEIPTEFKLYQNYPNPFNPATKIRFDVKSETSNVKSKIQLNVYNSLGQVVKILVNSVMDAGTYEYEFDGTNYPSGVYFYQLTAGDYKETKRMVLVK